MKCIKYSIAIEMGQLTVILIAFNLLCWNREHVFIAVGFFSYGFSKLWISDWQSQEI